MIIDIKTIPREGTKRFKFSLDKDWLRREVENDQFICLDTPLTVKADIYRARDKYVLEGTLEGSVQLLCDRCLEPYSRDLRADVSLLLVMPPPDMEGAEIELTEEDMEIGFIRGEEINMDEIIREQFYLSLPVKSLCKEDCLGLCPICGGNLNKGECRCKDK
jgi:uncharacterized protein